MRNILETNFSHKKKKKLKENEEGKFKSLESFMKEKKKILKKRFRFPFSALILSSCCYCWRKHNLLMTKDLCAKQFLSVNLLFVVFA